MAALGGLATWDGQHVVVSAAWLVVSVALVSARFGSRAGAVAAITATVVQLVVFGDIDGTGGDADYGDILAVIATAVLSGVVVMAVRAAESSRQRAVAALGARDALVEQLARMMEITSRLASARTTDDLVTVVVEDIRRGTGAVAASLWVVEGDRLRLRGASGYDADVLRNYVEVPLDAEVPVAEAVRRQRVALAANREEMVQRWPAIADDIRHQGLASLPLVIEGTAIGSIGLSFSSPPPSARNDVAFLVALAARCSDALLRARLYDAEREARKAAEEASSRLAFLDDASDKLNATLEWETTLEQIVAMSVPMLADWCAVFVWDDRDVLVPLAWAGSGWGDSEVVLEGARRSSLLDEPSREEAADGVSTAFAPMSAAGRRVGAIALGTTAAPSLHDQDLATAEELARRGAQAAVNAFLFGERVRVARSLQQSLLPPATPSVPGLEVATRFHALGEGLDVGGDFYDIVRMGHPTAPADRWAVTIGDVRGKGAEAAAVTGAARYALRAFALEASSPAAMLRSLNELLLVSADEAGDAEPRFCTAVVALVEPTGEGARVVVGSAGHPSPVVLRYDGAVEVTELPGSLLGVLADPAVEDAELWLGPGDALVLYTDGITERHEGDRFFEVDGLVTVLSRCAGFTADVLAERIETAARAFVEAAPRDDLAIVVVRVPVDTALATGASAELPADTTAPRRARRFVTLALERYGLDDLVERAVLLTSEVVTNAVIHGGGNVRISIERNGTGVRIAVTDASPSRPRRLDLGVDATSGRGVQFVEQLADHWGVDSNPPGKVVWFELHS